jgi:hypothetical protein
MRVQLVDLCLRRIKDPYVIAVRGRLEPFSPVITKVHLELKSCGKGTSSLPVVIARR